MTARATLPTDELLAGVRQGDRAILGRAITLVESRSPAHRARARELLERLRPYTGGAHRVAITGSPGVGKSTLIEAIGSRLTAAGTRVAVLAIDPTSSVSGGSILGDKTRMTKLASDPNAFVRPSPTAGSLGGVAAATREGMLVCEAAGYDVVLIETVGVGQSELVAAGMVDTFVVLLLAGGGDQLQGIKRGVLELADVLAITKADGDNADRARQAASDYQGALRLLRSRTEGWTPPLSSVSALTGAGLTELWADVTRHREALVASGELTRRRSRQQVSWMWSLVEDQLRARLVQHPEVRRLLANTEQEVEAGRLTAGTAAERILDAFGAGGAMETP